MKKVDTHADDTRLLRNELDRLFFTDDEPDVEKIIELGERLDELEPSVNNETIEHNKKELLRVVDKQLDKEASALLLKRAEVIRKSKLPYKASRAAAVFISVICLSSITAYAFGVNLFSLIADFGDSLNKLKLISHSTASHSPAPLPTDDFTSPTLVEMQQFADAQMALDAMPVKPKYPLTFPAGIELVDIQMHRSGSSYAKLDFVYMDAKSNESLFITIVYYDAVESVSRDFTFIQDYFVVERYYEKSIEYIVVQDESENYFIYWVDSHHVYSAFSKSNLDVLKTIVGTFE